MNISCNNTVCICGFWSWVVLDTSAHFPLSLTPELALNNESACEYVGGHKLCFISSDPSRTEILSRFDHSYTNTHTSHQYRMLMATSKPWQMNPTHDIPATGNEEKKRKEIDREWVKESELERSKKMLNKY